MSHAVSFSGVSPITAGSAAHSLRSRPFAGDGLWLRSFQHEGGCVSRPSAGPAAREALQEEPMPASSGVFLIIYQPKYHLL